ncbi:MAG: hypothetical protein ACYTHK_04205 [Planctomycetota bacterium]|jgi:hypothetical protein
MKNVGPIALVVAAFAVIILSSIKDESIRDIQQAVTTTGGLLALLSLAGLVRRTIWPGETDFEQLGMLAVGVTAGAALFHGTWGAYLPLTAAVGVVGALKLRQT